MLKDDPVEEECMRQNKRIVLGPGAGARNHHMTESEPLLHYTLPCLQTTPLI